VNNFSNENATIPFIQGSKEYLQIFLKRTMKIKKVFALFLIVVLAEVVFACFSCECPKAITNYYNLKFLSVSNLYRNADTLRETTTPEILAKNYGLRLKIRGEKVAYTKPSGSLFITSAYACDCIGRVDIANEYIETIKIFTINNYDSIHASGSDVSEYFKVFDRSYNKPSDIPFFLKRQNDLFVDYDGEIGIDLVLETAPILKSKHQFNIEILLSNGLVLKAQTTLIGLN